MLMILGAVRYPWDKIDDWKMFIHYLIDVYGSVGHYLNGVF